MPTRAGEINPYEGFIYLFFTLSGGVTTKIGG
jgi:hypothetical protein